MTDYHDFVFKEGKLVGRFEDMYREASTIPWHQDEQESWLDVDVTINLLKWQAPFSAIRDYGCGLGYFLEILVRRLGDDDTLACGYDISLTACTQAKTIFPDYTFEKLDLQVPAPPDWSGRKTMIEPSHPNSTSSEAPSGTSSQRSRTVSRTYIRAQDQATCCV